MRAKTHRIYLLKYLYHLELDRVMMNFDIQALMNLRTLKNKILLLDYR
jgi:hypothetical protein